MKKIVVVVLLVVGLLVGFFMFRGDDQPNDEQDQQQSQETTEPEDSNKPISYKQLTGDEYKELFLDSSHPNTKPIVETPVITGNAEADKHIARIALGRGYLLQQVPQTDLIESNGQKIQKNLEDAWNELAKEAKSAGIDLEIVSSLRTIEEQRQLFINRINEQGIPISQISSGSYDAQLDSILSFTAPPGYSRHHSGYVIDIADKSASVFEFSEGFKWLSADNYLKAKQHGIIPSYPEGAQNQGPEPEAWEYVWVGQPLLIE